jgi:hypothetical protein
MLIISLIILTIAKKDKISISFPRNILGIILIVSGVVSRRNYSHIKKSGKEMSPIIKSRYVNMIIGLPLLGILLIVLGNI